MILNINFPEDLMTSATIERKQIPCICSIQMNGYFDILFQQPLFFAKGHVTEFEKSEINSRFPVLGGSAVAQHCNAMVSLEKINNSRYEITDLVMFYPFKGWVTIMENTIFSKVQIDDFDGY